MSSDLKPVRIVTGSSQSGFEDIALFSGDMDDNWILGSVDSEILIPYAFMRKDLFDGLNLNSALSYTGPDIVDKNGQKIKVFGEVEANLGINHGWDRSLIKTLTVKFIVVRRLYREIMIGKMCIEQYDLVIDRKMKIVLLREYFEEKTIICNYPIDMDANYQFIKCLVTVDGRKAIGFINSASSITTINYQVCRFIGCPMNDYKGPRVTNNQWERIDIQKTAEVDLGIMDGNDSSTISVMKTKCLVKDFIYGHVMIGSDSIDRFNLTIDSENRKVLLPKSNL